MASSVAAVAAVASSFVDNVWTYTKSFPAHQSAFVEKMVEQVNIHFKPLAQEIVDVMAPILEYKDLGDGRGTGVHANGMIPANTVVSLYVGDVYHERYQDLYPNNLGDYFQVVPEFEGPPGVGTLKLVIDGEKYKRTPGSSSTFNHSCEQFNCRITVEEIHIWINEGDRQQYEACETTLQTVGDRRKRTVKDQVKSIEQDMEQLARKSRFPVCFLKTVTIVDILAGTELLVDYNGNDPQNYGYLRPISVIYQDIQNGDVSDSDDVHPCRCAPRPNVCPRDMFMVAPRSSGKLKTDLDLFGEAWKFSSLIWRASRHLPGPFDVCVRFPTWDTDSLVFTAGGDMVKRNVFADGGEVLASVVVIEKDSRGSTEFFPYNDKMQAWYEAFKNVHKLEPCPDGIARVLKPPNAGHVDFMVSQMDFKPRLFHYFIRRAMKVIVARHCHTLPPRIVVDAFELAETNIHTAFWQR